jgi:hypothetical protein
MNRARSIARLAIVAAVGVVWSISAHAVGLTAITWGTPTTISGDTDVDTVGTLVYAFNFGSDTTATTQTINGVTFQPFAINNNALSSTATVGNVTLTESNGYLIADVDTGSANAPFTALSANYRSLLSTEVYSSNLATMQVDLGGLTNGSAYRLQWWTNDSSDYFYAGSPFFENVIGGGASGNVTLDSNTSNTNGGLGQYVIGTFTASGTMASFTLTGSGTGAWQFPMMNALQVRAVPEPATYVIALIGMACGGYSLFRRRKRA